MSSYRLLLSWLLIFTQTAQVFAMPTGGGGVTSNGGTVVYRDGNLVHARGGAGGVMHPGNGGGGNQGGDMGWVYAERRRLTREHLAQQRHRRIVAEQERQAAAEAERQRIEAERAERERVAQEYRRDYGDYQFITPADHPSRESLTSHYRDLYRYEVPQGIADFEMRQRAREQGLTAYREADQSFISENDPQVGNAYIELGAELANIAMGINPVTSMGASAYELLTGRDLLTQREIGNFGRLFAAVNLLSIGSVRTVGQTSGALVRILGRSEVAMQRVTRYINDASALVHNGFDTVSRSLRRTPGIARAAEHLHEPVRLLRGTRMNAALVPASIAQRLHGREFRNFDQFRRAFWREMAESPYAREFVAITEENLGLMRRGLAPIADRSEWLSPRIRTYQLHHIENIQHGGSVYDLGNLVIASPLFHNRNFHGRF